MEWKTDDNKKLESLYNSFKTDAYIAEELKRTLFAVQKQRSVLGFVRHKVSGRKNKLKVAVEQPEKIQDYILHYNDGVDHFIAGTEAGLKLIAENKLRLNNIKSVVLYKATKKLIIQHIREIEL